GRLRAAKLDVEHRAGGALADHELLEAVPAGLVAYLRAHRLVAHRQHPGGEAERAALLVDRLGQPRALAQAARPAHAERQVAVAEVEPDVVAQLAQAVHHVERVAGEAPAALVDQVREPERDEVGVRRDVGAVDLDVVAGVGDHRELVADDVEQPAGELRAAGTAREQDYHSSSGRPLSLMPACVLWRTLTPISSAVSDSAMRAASSGPA